MIESINQKLSGQMEKSIVSLKDELGKLRSGRANPTLLDTVLVEYYGNKTPISQMANVSVPEARLIVVQPWDQSSLGDIEKAIQKSDLGLSPQNDGKIIRIPLPALTEDRRKEIVKQASKVGEDARIAIRNIRRSGLDEVKQALKDKEITEDDQKRAQDLIQKTTDGFIAKVDQIVEEKSKEIMAV
ncbi:MAG: ribosome recycling factor [Bdellovibrionales bacterium]|nr:ribosome recycling factor [Bdellovibrionales bacterium]